MFFACSFEVISLEGVSAIVSLGMDSYFVGSGVNLVVSDSAVVILFDC